MLAGYVPGTTGEWIDAVFLAAAAWGIWKVFGPPFNRKDFK